MYRLAIKSPDGEEIELLTSYDEDFSKGAKEGAIALLNLMYDEFDLDEGFDIKLSKD